jgi:hypothetical protein
MGIGGHGVEGVDRRSIQPLHSIRCVVIRGARPILSRYGAGSAAKAARVPRMSRTSFVSLVAAASFLVGMPLAWAHSPNSCGRYLGIGWSDGYHSHTACPPKRHEIHQRQIDGPVMTTAPIAPAPVSIPWWKIPAAPNEAVPAEPIPAPPAQTASSTTVSGQSLFRQPGEGSSVTTLNAPQR